MDMYVYVQCCSISIILWFLAKQESHGYVLDDHDLLAAYEASKCHAYPPGDTLCNTVCVCVWREPLELP